MCRPVESVGPFFRKRLSEDRPDLVVSRGVLPPTDSREKTA